ncbi:MAG: glycosyltransferase [Bacteroidota bacterium]|jgi:glycosyltransferase involved in cell wall biosynthesis
MLRKKQLFLICTGLGIVQRGFETYMSDLSDKLQTTNALFTTKLYTGGNYYSSFNNSKKLFCISRTNRFCIQLIGKNNTAELELISFFFSLLVEILFKKPNAIYLGEYKLYCYLFKIRKLLNLDYSLVLYTGGQVSPGLYNIKKDFVHHITDVYYNDLVKKGYPKARQFVLPHFVTINYKPTSIDKCIYEAKSIGKKIIISVGVIDESIKRMGFFVKILSHQPNIYFPVLLGESSNETPGIITALDSSFGKGNYFVDRVNRSTLYSYLNESDVFVLLSKKESFGLAALEAISVGLPVICCDFYESRYVLKNSASLIDCNNIDEIRNKLKDTLDHPLSLLEKQERINFVKENYIWDVLEKAYLNMFNTAVQNN